MNLRTTGLRTALRGVVCTAAIGAAVVAGTGVSAAQSQTGWVGPTAPIDGVIYLHSSTISDTPQLAASTAIYPSFGQSVPEFRMGVQSRLFKSGVLCQITPWQYNVMSTSRLENATTGHCGSGSYNSHGFVQAGNGVTWSNYVTFPTNPIDFVAPAAPSARTAQSTPAPEELASGTNANGQTFGSAVDANSPEESPDLIASYGTNGAFGYIRSDEVSTVDASASIPLYANDGRTVVGSFDVR